MSMETRRQEQDVKVYRCDLVWEDGRCVRETASFHSEGDVTVFMDASWVVIRVGLGEERQFCCWDHMATWTTRENAAAKYIEAGNTTDDGYGDFATRMRAVTRTRDEREDVLAQASRKALTDRERASELLGFPG